MGMLLVFALTLLLGGCSAVQSRSPAVSILVDLDPASVERSVIVESITADKQGRLYLPDRVTGNILRVESKVRKSTPTRPASLSINKVIFSSLSARTAK